MGSMIDNEMLDVLADALMSLFKEEHWSKSCCASNQGAECPPWDLHADAWSSFGAIERALVGRDRMSDLSQVVGEMEQDTQQPLLTFDASHSHREVVETFYATIGRLTEKVGLVMMTPAFMDDPKDWPDDEWPLMLIEQAALDEMDKAENEQRDRFEVAMAEERDAWQYAREDEPGTLDEMDEVLDQASTELKDRHAEARAEERRLSRYDRN